MSLGKRLINTGGVSEAACLTEDVNPFTGTSADGGVALYSLDYDASDESGNYDGTPTDVDFGVGGQINYGARFNGSSSGVSISATATTPIDYNSRVYSIAFWIKLPSIGNSEQVIAKYGASDSNRAASIIIHTDGTIRFLERTSTTNNRYSTSALSANTWHHVVVSRSTTGVSFFIDGELKVSGDAQTYSFTPNSGGTESIRFGRNNSSNPSYGEIDLDQVRFFTSTLTEANAATLYAEEACVHTSTTDVVGFPTSASDDIVAYYKLDNSSEDIKGSYDGTDTNIEYRFGRFGQAAVFNGSSSYIQASNAISNLESNFSISVWVNSDVNHFGGIINLGGKIILRTSNADLTVWQWNANKLIYDSTAPSANSAYYTYSNINPANTWTHITYVKTGTGNSDHKIYKNGVFQAQPSATNIASAGWTNLGTTIGLFGQSGSTKYNYFDGKIDQVRIYDAALTSDQVTELYNEKPEVDTSNFKTVLWEGNGNDNRYISNLGIDLETSGGLVWTKTRTAAYYHQLQDSVRGAGANAIYSNSTDAENGGSSTYNADFGYINSFEANGWFTKNGSDGLGTWVNRSGNDYVAWVWKGGGDAVTGTGTGVTNVSKSVNADAGFSIVEYTGGGSASNTVEHGFDNQTPELIIVKCISDAAFWCVWSSQLTSNYNLALNLTNAQFAANSGSNGGLGDATSSDITFVSGSVNLNTVNGSGRDYIAYCFHSVSGYSKIGSYEGLGTSTVTVSGLGFKPSWIIVKNADDTSNWNIYDSRRSGNDSGWGSMDTMNDILYPNLNIAEVEGGSTHVFTANSDGFVVGASNHLQNNKAGDTFIYMAFK